MLCLPRRLLRDLEDPLVSRSRNGSVAQDMRSKVWNFFWWENGKRKCKSLGRFPTKAAAWHASKPLRDALEAEPETSISAPTVRSLVEQYRVEKMPKRHDTRKGYESWLRVFIMPKWGDSRITELQARPVELWLEALDIAPKSRVHIRGILNNLWNYAMWKQALPVQVNPISLVRVKGASKRKRKARILEVHDFRKLLCHLQEPFNVLALLCVCFGLRISETLGLKWHDVDWLKETLRVERGIVQQVTDDVKTEESRKTLMISPDLLAVLKDWKQATQFSHAEDWVFASPFQIGRLPYSYTCVKETLRRAATAAGIGDLTSHAFRHTYRSWLDFVRASIGVQQQLMRHTDVRQTMNYGEAITQDMRDAHGKIVKLALNGM